MRILKKLLIGLVLVIALLLIVALFVKKDYAIEREVTINKPKQEVFNYVKYVKNQDNFSVWNQKDPNMKKSYSGTDGTVGFVYAWESNDEHVGKGEQEIVKITEGERMDMKLRFKEPFEAEDNAYLVTESVSPTQTKVKWGFNGAFHYPMNLMGLMMDMDKEVGGDLAKGLANLKTVMESK